MMLAAFNPYPPDKWYWWLVTSRLYITYPNIHHRVISADDVCTPEDIDLSLPVKGISKKWLYPEKYNLLN